MIKYQHAKCEVMKKSSSYVMLLAVISVLSLFSCSSGSDATAVRSVYYWSTTMDMDSVKTSFLRNHDVSRMYVRFFDVVRDADGNSVPNATLQFATRMPSGVDVIPVVFVMPECMNGDRAALARQTVGRVCRMCETNDVADVKELQIDCDWTVSTRGLYRDFMRYMLAECHSRGLRLSSTVRLHQLAQTPPPADRGVLMVYNTGDVADPHCRKPILDMNDAAPYLGYLRDYPLHLAAAYPVFSWRVLWRGGHFVGIVHYNGEYPVVSGDSIAVHAPTADEIIGAIKAVGRRRPDANAEVILFDLSNKNINRIKYDDYEKIFNP